MTLDLEAIEERLRKGYWCRCGDRVTDADTDIEVLVGEVRRLTEENDRLDWLHSKVAGFKRGIAEAEAERDRYKQALETIAANEPWYPAELRDHPKVARQALKENT